MRYTIETAGPTIVGEVFPTMEALGDQPWCVRLYHNGTQIASRFIEASSGLEAVTAARRTGWRKKALTERLKLVEI